MYKISELGPKGEEERLVETLDELRKLAQDELTPLS